MDPSPPTPAPRSSSPPGHSLILGRAGFARISAVDGRALTDAMRATLERFDRDGLSADERRRLIIARFTPSTR